MKVLQKKEIKKKSTPVTDIDIQVTPFLVYKMAGLCKKQIGRYAGGLAIAHCQVEKNNPLTFFVLACGDAIVNPEIIKGTAATMSLEGCMSLSDKPEYRVRRFNRIKVKYTLLSKNKNTIEIKIVEKWIKDKTAYIFQHEIDHFNLKYVDEN